MFNLRQDYLAGLFVAGIGVFFSVDSFLYLPIGNVTRMGPGFFPIILGIFLTGLGVLMTVRGHQSGFLQFRTIPFRGIALISVSLIVFALTLTPIGFLASVAVSVFIASRAHEGLSILVSTATAVTVSLMCALIFVVGLGQNIPLFGTVLGG